jgi:hypothetical protein
MLHKSTLKTRFPSGWHPSRRLSPEAIEGIKVLRNQVQMPKTQAQGPESTIHCIPARNQFRNLPGSRPSRLEKHMEALDGRTGSSCTKMAAKARENYHGNAASRQISTIFVVAAPQTSHDSIQGNKISRKLRTTNTSNRIFAYHLCTGLYFRVIQVPFRAYVQ